MPEILKNGQLVPDDWQVLRPEAETDLATFAVPAGRWLLPFALWQAQREHLAGRTDIGVWLSPTDDLSAVAPHFAAWPLLAVDFPKFTDGRGYSIAWRLRNQYRYAGELRAIGNVLLDQLFFMQRVGFDTLALDTTLDATQAPRYLAPFPDVYQGSTDNPAPLFRRVARDAQHNAVEGA